MSSGSRKVFASFSGGKDSTAMILRMAELKERIDWTERMDELTWGDGKIPADR